MPAPVGSAATSRLDRRSFIAGTSGAILCALSGPAGATGPGAGAAHSPSEGVAMTSGPGVALRLLLCGDVMTGRGIDQIQRHSCNPRLYERYVKSAQEYVAIAEQANGPIPRGVDPSYVWGDVLPEVQRLRPDVRIVNLETAVTTASEPWPGKGIHYRMHPANVACLTAAGIDCCALANNHVLDWGYDGLEETLETLRAAHIRTVGAGVDETSAQAPAVIECTGGRRVVVLAYGSPSSGIPGDWQARIRRAGVNLLDESDPSSLQRVARDVRDTRRPVDCVVASLHWGGNWGYSVPREQQRLARALIDEAGVDVVYGHSSHHPRPIEVHAGKPILYGCGDCLNDYEGIGGYEIYRPELAFLYLVDLDAASGRLGRLTLVPMRIRKFRLNRASDDETAWLEQTLTRECREFGTRLERAQGGLLELRWG